MMLSPTPVTKPTRTARETNLSAVPARASPMAIITIPTRIDSMNNALPGSSAFCTPGTSVMIAAIALVTPIVIVGDAVNSAPPAMPIMFP